MANEFRLKPPSWRDEPPSTKQINLILDLGESVPSTRGEASDLITKLIQVSKLDNWRPSPAQGVSAAQWAHMTEGERWDALGERPWDPDPYEPGGPGWMDD